MGLFAVGKGHLSRRRPAAFSGACFRRSGHGQKYEGCVGRRRRRSFWRASASESVCELDARGERRGQRCHPVGQEVVIASDGCGSLGRGMRARDLDRLVEKESSDARAKQRAGKRSLGIAPRGIAFRFSLRECTRCSRRCAKMPVRLAFPKNSLCWSCHLCGRTSTRSQVLATRPGRRSSYVKLELGLPDQLIALPPLCTDTGYL